MPDPIGAAPAQPLAAPARPVRPDAAQPMAQRRGHDSEDNATLRGGQGAAVKAGQTLWHDGNVRLDYDTRSAQLGRGPQASAARDALKLEARQNSTAFGRGLAEHMANDPKRLAARAAKTPEQMAASAARSNPGVNALGKGFRYGGKALVGVGAAISVYDVATAPPGRRVEQATKEAGSWAGALAFGTAGMEGGAALGTMIVPGLGTAIGGAVGGLVGGAVGAIGGEKAVPNVWDYFTGH